VRQSVTSGLQKLRSSHDPGCGIRLCAAIHVAFVIISQSTSRSDAWPLIRRRKPHKLVSVSYGARDPSRRSASRLLLRADLGVRASSGFSSSSKRRGEMKDRFDTVPPVGGDNEVEGQTAMPDRCRPLSAAADDQRIDVQCDRKMDDVRRLCAMSSNHSTHPPHRLLQLHVNKQLIPAGCHQ